MLNLQNNEFFFNEILKYFVIHYYHYYYHYCHGSKSSFQNNFILFREILSYFLTTQIHRPHCVLTSVLPWRQLTIMNSKNSSSSKPKILAKWKDTDLSWSANKIVVKLGKKVPATSICTSVINLMYMYCLVYFTASWGPGANF